MNGLTTELAKALNLISFASTDRGARDTAKEALRLYDAANHIADASKLVPPISGAHEVWATVPKEFSDWWDADELPHGNPFREDSPAYWAFAGWQARAAQAATPAPALYVGLIERLMRLSTRLGIAHEGGVEHFAAGLEDRLYAICRGAEGLLDSMAATPAPAPLTNAQFERLYNNLPPSIQQDTRSRLAFIRIGRAVEAAHGIGASTKESNK